MVNVAQEIGDRLKKHKLTVGAVESATGGLISHRLTDIPGSSVYYMGSVISYSNEVKIKVVGVRKETVERYGAVSPQVAEEMALGGCRLLGVDICISDTGIAGPGGATPDKPVGLFYLGLAYRGESNHRGHIFTGSREENKQAAAEAALIWLREYLLRLG